MLLDMGEPDVWPVWRPGLRPGWSGTQFRRRWELVLDPSRTWTLRFVDHDDRVSRSDSGTADEIAAVIRRAVITRQARLRLLEALRHPEELGPRSRVVITVT
jgi:hypothetical protein